MHIDQLRYFLIACESKSFSAAAKTAFTSRQNFTRSIEMLEHELGITLFQRSSDGTTLTYQGALAKVKAQRILAEVADLLNIASVNDETNMAPRLKVAFSENFMVDLPIEFSDLSGFPITISEITFSRCYERVVEGTVDLAFVVCMERDFPKCNSLPLGRIPMGVLCRKGSTLAAKETVGMKDLHGYDLILAEDCTDLYGKFLDEYKSLSPSGARITEMASVQAMENVLQCSDAATINVLTYEPVSKNADFVVRRWKDSQFDFCVYALFRGASNKTRSAIVEHVRSLLSGSYEE